MKKYSITIKGKNDQEKEVSVYVLEETAALLDQCDEEIRRVYLEEEYRAACVERAETRRHISLDESMDNGHDFAADEPSAYDLLIQKRYRIAVKKLLAHLTDKQKQVITMHYFEGKSFSEIAKVMDIKRQVVHKHFCAAQKKLKKIKISFQNRVTKRNSRGL